MASTRCMCCGYKTLGAPDTMALCPVCWWGDDGQDDSDADIVRNTVNGRLSLSDARQNYLRFGASDIKFVPQVREPQAEEH
jgi:Cysteine-rich CPCC